MHNGDIISWSYRILIDVVRIVAPGYFLSSQPIEIPKNSISDQLKIEMDKSIEANKQTVKVVVQRSTCSSNNKHFDAAVPVERHRLFL